MYAEAAAEPEGEGEPLPKQRRRSTIGGYTILYYTILYYTPSPPTKSFPTKSPRVKLSGRPPIKFYGHENSHPLELRVCLSQTL